MHEYNTIELKSLDDALAFCVAEKFKGKRRTVPIEEIGIYANWLLPKAERVKRKTLDFLYQYPDKFCVSMAGGGGVQIVERPTFPSLAEFDSPADASASTGSIVLEEPITVVDLLRESVERYTSARFEFAGSLGKESKDEDATKLANSFAKCIAQHGFLRLSLLHCQYATGLGVRFTGVSLTAGLSCFLLRLTMPALCEASLRRLSCDRSRQCTFLS